MSRGPGTPCEAAAGRRLHGHTALLLLAAAALAAPLAALDADAQDAVAPPVILTANATLASTPAVLHGTAAPGAAISVTSGTNPVGSAQADPTSGYWRLEVPLAEGRNALSVAATVEGTASRPSLAILVLDTTPPDAPVLLNTANEAAPSRMHVIRGTAEPSSLVEVYVNGTLRGSGTAHYAGGSWFIQVLLGAGANSVTARAVDGIGNPSALASVAITAPAGSPPARTLDKPPVPIAAIDDDEGTLTLTAPTSVKAFESGGRAYAVVAAGGSAAVQVVDFTDPRRPAAAATIQDDSRRLGQPRDIEVFTAANGDRIAAVTSLSPGAVELINMNDPLNPSFAASAHIGNLDSGGASLYPQLLGARDAAVFDATVNGTAGTYIMVVSDYGPTALNPGGFQIINVTHHAAPTPVSANHAVLRDGEGRHVMARPPTAAPGVSPTSTTALNLGNPQIIAAFDDDGDPVARTANATLPGYSRNFSVPVEGLYTANSYGPNPSYSLGLGVVMEVRNSTDHIVSRTLNGRTFMQETCNPGPHLSVCSDQFRLIKLHNNDTPNDKSDDYIIEVYRDGLHGPYNYSVAKLVGSKMLSVDVDGSPFPLRGVDPDGRPFEALEGARSVDTFASGGNTYAVVAARDADAVQIVNVTDPTRPRVVAEAREGGADGAGGTFDELDGATGVAIAQVGGRSYAVVAAQHDNGVQIIDVTDPASPRATASVSDEPGSSRKKFSMLGGATGVDVFEQNGRTYALVSSWDDDGFQVIDISDPSAPTATDRGHDGNRCSTAARYSALGGATASDTLAVNGRLYALVAANFDDGLQVVDITDPTRLVVRGAVFDELGGFSELQWPLSAHAAEIGGREYVFVSSYQDHIEVVNGENFGRGGSVQIMDVTDPANPRAAAALVHSDRSQFDLLHGVRGIDTFVIGARTYAIITAELPQGHPVDQAPFNDKGAFTIADVSNPDRPRLVFGARDGQPDANGGTFDMLNAPAGVDTAVINGNTYAVIAARGPYPEQDHGVQIVDVTNPRSPLAVKSIRDGDADGAGGTFGTLSRAHGVEMVRIGQGWYALVAAIRDNGVQIINITDPSSPRAAAGITDDGANTALGGAYSVKAFEKGGMTYAIVSSKNDNGVQMLNITDPASPDPIDRATDSPGFANDRQFSELNGAHEVDLFTHGGNAYAAVASMGLDHHLDNCGNARCSGVQIINMTSPADIRAFAAVWDTRETGGAEFHLRGARGIATFTAGESTYAAVTGFTGDQVQIMRLAAAADSRAPAAVEASFNRERGLLYVTFDELVKTSTNVDLSRMSLRSAGQTAVPLGGASLADASDGKTVVIALTDVQKAAAAALTSPELRFTQAGAFEDLAGNDLPSRSVVHLAIVTSNPEILGARMDLGTGEISLAFTEAVNSSEVDTSRIAVYSSGAPQVRYFPSSVATEGGNPEITVRLGLHERQAVIAFAGTPLVDVLDGAVNSSETGRPSAEYRGSPLKPVIEDRVDPNLLSASLDGRLLTLVFDEYVNVAPSKFDLDQMYLRDAAGGAGDEVSLDGADLLTARNGTAVLVNLTAQQGTAAAGYARLVLDMRLSGPYSAVEDLSGQGIGAVRGFAVSSTVDTAAPGYSATATASDRITVNFTERVTGTAIGPETVWSLSGFDEIGFEKDGSGARIALTVTGYAGVQDSDSLVLVLSGLLPDTSPNISLVYNGSGDIADAAGNRMPLNSTVRVADGLAPGISSAAITGPNEATITFTETVLNPRAALVGLELDPGSTLGASTRNIDYLERSPAGTAKFVFDGDRVRTNATGTLTVDQMRVMDVARNAMGSNTEFAQRLADGQGPAVLSAAITAPDSVENPRSVDQGPPPRFVYTGLQSGPNNVTIRYSEPASAPLSAYAGVDLDRGGVALANGMLVDRGGGARAVTGLSGNLTDTHVVTFGGDTVALGAAGAITINEAAVLDTASPRPNPLGDDAALRVPLPEGRVPDLVSAKVTGPNNVTITYGASYGGSVGNSYPLLTVGGQGRSATNSDDTFLSATHTIAFGGDPAPSNATGVIAMDTNNLVKLGGVLGSGWLISVLDDGQAPSIAAAVAVSNDTIRVTFDEPASAMAASGAGWSVSDGDADGLTVTASSDISSGSETLNITLSGALPDTRPDGITLSYAAPASGGIIDAAGNAPAALSAAVGDGLAPYIASATVSGPNEATVRYSEPVNASWPSAYPTVTLGASDERTVASLSGNGTAVHVLTFRGTAAAAGATGTVAVNERLIEDAAGNRLGDSAALSRHLTDGQAPRITSAAVTAPDKATIMYSRAVSALQSDYTSLVVDGEARTISSVSGNTLTSTHVITFSPGGAPPSANGSLAIAAANVADENSVRLGTGQVSQELADGQAPRILSANATSLTTIRVAFDEPITAGNTAGTGWTISGANASGRTVVSSSDASSPTTVLNLTLSGGLASTRPDGVTLSYAPSASGVVADAARNLLQGSAPVGDGIAPEIASAVVRAARAVEVVYTEQVYLGASAYAGLGLTPGGDRGVPAVFTGNGSATHVLEFGDLRPETAAAANATGTLTINQTALADASGNPLGRNAAFSRHLADGQAPRVDSAVAVSLREILVSFDEPVSAAGTSGAGDWTISGDEAAMRGVSSRSDVSAGSATLTLTLDGNLADDSPSGITLSYTPGAVAFADPAGNELGRFDPRAVADGIVPRIVSASITAGNTATIEYSEPVARASGAYSALSLTTGGSRTPVGPLGTFSDTHTVTFGDAAAATNATGSITMNQTVLVDESGNALGDNPEFRRLLADGQAPTIEGGAITAGNMLTITYSEPVSRDQSAYASLELSPGDTRSSLDLSPGTPSDTHAITFDGTAAAANATGTLTMDATRLVDASGNALGDSNALRRDMDDGQAPSVVNATAVSLSEIRVEFDEPVNATGTAGGGGWSILGGEWNSRSVSYRSDISAGSTSLALTLDGNLVDDSPSGITLRYATGTVNFTDASGNMLGTVASQAVADGIVPRLRSANFTAADKVTVTYSEPVTAQQSAYSALSLTSGGTATDLTLAGDTTATHVITFAGVTAAANATGVLTLNATRLADASGNALVGSGELEQRVEDGQAPTITGGAITAGDTLTITYSEPVSRDQSAYASLELSPGDTRSSLDLSPGTPSDTHAITFDGTAAAANATGTLTMDATRLVDASGNALGDSNALRRDMDDGQAPSVVNATAVSLSEIRVEFDEPVNATGTAGGGGWSILGGEWNSRSVSYRSDISAGSTSLALTLDGNLVDDSPSGITLRYATGTVNFTDASGNMLGTVASQAVADGIVPRLRSANFTAADKVTVTYSEPVTAQQSAYSALSLTSGGTATDLTLAGDTTATHVITFAGVTAAANATGVLTLNATRLADASGNALVGSGELEQRVEDGQAPTITGGAITAGDTLTITYSEPVTQVPSAYTALSLTPGGTRSPSGPSGSASATHAVTFGGRPADTNATGILTVNQTLLADESGNAMGTGTLPQDLADGQGPKVTRSAITGGRNLTITYSEPVAAAPSAYSMLVLDDSEDRTITLFAGNLSAVHVVNFTGAAAPLRATGTVAIDETAVRDLAPASNALGTATRSVSLHDDRAPSIVTAKVTGPGNATILYSRAVAAAQQDYTQLMVGGSARTVTGLAGGDGNGAEEHVLSFTPADAPPNATGSVTINGTAVLDEGGRQLGTGPLSRGLADGQAPGVANATAISLNEIRVEFDEPVSAAGTSVPGGWSVGDGDSAGLAVASRPDASAASAAITLTLDGNLPDTRPDGVMLRYTAGGGDSVRFEDGAGNPLGTSSAAVGDGIAPEVVSANVTAADKVTVTYSEPVAASQSAYAGLSLTSGGTPMGLTLAGSATEAHVITFAGATAAANATGTLTVNETRLADASGNALGNRTAFPQNLKDGQAPALLSARITGPGSLAVTYSEPVAGTREAYSGVTILGTARPVESLSGSATAVHLISLGGMPAAATNATGSIDVDQTALADASGNALGDSARAEDLADGQMPELVSSTITGPNTVTVRYSEPVTAPLSAYAGVDLASDGTRTVDALVGNGTAVHAVGFAGMPAASHAEGNMTIDARAVLDAASPPNSLGTAPALVQRLADDRDPSIVSAVITAPDRATVRYDRPVSAPQSAYSSLVVDGSNRTVAAPFGGNGTRVHHLVFAPGGAPPNATGYVTIDGSAVSNPDGGALGTGPENRTLADGQAPSVLSARITAGNALTIRYSEPVARDPSAYAGLELLPGGARDAAGPSGAPSASHEVAFGGDAAAANATGALTIDQTALADAAGNALGTGAAFRQPVADGQAPSVLSARITAGNALTIRYSEPVARDPSAYAGLELLPGGARDAAGPSGSPSASHEVAFGGDAAAANATGTLTIDQTALADAAGNALGGRTAFPQDLADGQAPSFSATAVSTSAIRVEFDEPVSAAGTAGRGGWSVSGGDAAGLSVASRSDISSGSAVLTLMLGGSLPDTAPDGVVLSYGRGAAPVADAAGNEPVPRGGSGAVLDGIAPAVASAYVSGANAATVSYTEPVTASADPPAYSGLVLDNLGARDILGFTAGRAALHAIEFGGAPVLPDAEGGVAIDLSLVIDAAGNAAGSGTVRQALAAGQAPPTLAAANASAAFTTPNTVVVTYSHGLGRPPSAPAGPVYGGVTVEPAGGAPSSERSVVSESGIGTAVHTVRFGGAPVGAEDGGSIELLVDLQAGAVDAARVLHWREAGPIPILPGEGIGTVVVGPSEGVRVVEIAHDSFERRVNATAGGENATVAIDTSGLVRTPPPGAGGPAAVFPVDAGVTILATFAEVTFPPNVTARGLPADGLLELYVAPPSALPNASALAAAFEHGDPGTLVVNRMVEVGDNGTHVVFDLPVRILLAGQAGGSAFYVNGTDGAIVPIGTACAADDTAAVHAQLGGAGECQIDSADGADKVVHTYHLTLFGTVRIPAAQGSGPPPVVVAPAAPAPEPGTGALQFFGGGGAGGSGRGGGGGGGGGGSPLPADASVVALHSAAWDCSDGTVRIAASTSSRGDAPAPTVTVLSSGGSAEAERAAVPAGLPGLLDYEAPLPDDDVFSIRIVSVDGRSVSTASEAVRTGGACAGEAVFSEYAGGRGAQAGALQQGGPGDGAAGDAGAAGPSPGATAEPEPASAPAGTDGGAQDGTEPPARDPPGAGDGAAFEMEEGRGAAHYVGRYAEDSGYREWFSSTYPQYADICEAVGAAPGCVEAYLEEAGAASAAADGGAAVPAPAVTCRDGMALDADGRCVPDGGAGVGTGEGGSGPAAPGAEDDAPEPGADTVGGGGCLIATAAYGTELAPQVQALREYRDTTLLATGPGSAFMSAFSAAYYAFSPHVADLEREHPAFRHTAAALIAPMLHLLQVAAWADPASDASVVAHGAAAALLAAGLYAGIPAAGAALAAGAVRRRRCRSARLRLRARCAAAAA